MFQDPETSFKYRGYCSGLGEDSGEPAAGQGEKTEGGPGWRNLSGVPCVWTELLECGGGACSERGRENGQHQISRDHWRVYNSKLPFSILCIRG